MASKNYHAKILLFGEYTIIRGGQALALPLDRYACQWRQKEDTATAKISGEALRGFATYLRAVENRGWAEDILDTDRLLADLQAGWFLHSNIPIGYGLGSSGALCAAVYDRYARRRINPEEEDRYGELRHYLGLMESRFHGASSGVDPLICYLNRPTLIKPGGRIERVVAPPWPTAADGQFFLLDTQRPRQTGPLVERFLHKCEHPRYAQSIEEKLIPQTETAIQDFLSANWPELFAKINSISVFQWIHFREMIPDQFQDLWQEGLKSDLFRLKLCGAGGGGFLLGMTRNADQLRQNLPEPDRLIFLS